MLDEITKKRIDDMRDIVVGKLPDPTSQVDLITNALIYKFMNDIDKKAVSEGGVASFFIGKFSKFSWENIFNPKLTGHEKVELYTQGIESIFLNENIPDLFREIFKNTTLPFKDPKIFNLFINEVNNIEYDNSEDLGDSYEYLLSFMGTQGEAGQFRTPRHIIDFIVDIIQPKKNHKVLDPSCGTGGFLISCFKKIISENSSKKIGDKLSNTERKNLWDNINGYDISPDMIKFSLVNLYLHNFPNPNIFEYDTLSSDQRWNEYYDIILANPPFFSPKGGITPHNRFKVKSKRAEVLFIDYIHEHLKPNGRAGIVVPEGIIFDSSKKPYTTIRKQILKDLLGIISLPKGVFLPYTGAKTSILILDKSKGNKNSKIFYAKILQDGFSLNDKRNPIEINDLPLMKKNINEIINNEKTNKNYSNIHFIDKKIINKSEYGILNFKEYQKIKLPKSKYEIKKLVDIAKFVRGPFGGSLKKSIFVKKGYMVYEQSHVIANNFNKPRYFINKEKYESMKSFQINKDNILISCSGTMGKIAIVPNNYLEGIINQALLLLRVDQSVCNIYYLKYYLETEFIKKNYLLSHSGTGIENVAPVKKLKNIPIFLPSLKEQKEIIEKIQINENKINDHQHIIRKIQLDNEKLLVKNIWNSN